jgi:hypothetical protein
MEVEYSAIFPLINCLGKLLQKRPHFVVEMCVQWLLAQLLMLQLTFRVMQCTGVKVSGQAEVD